MSKTNQKPMSTDAANFLQFLRKHKPSQNPVQNNQSISMDSQKQNPSLQKEQDKQDLQMQSQSQLQAQQLFGNLAPEKSVQQQKPKSPNKKTTKKAAKKQQKKSQDVSKQEHKLNQTKSILRKGKMVEQNKSEEQQIELKPQKLEKKVPQVNRRSVSFEGYLPLNSELEKKWKDPIDNQRKGKFDKEEQKILSEAVGKFLVANDISLEQFENLLTVGERSDKTSKRQKVFSLLSTALPNRSPQSCYKYLKRNFNSLNRKGKWTEEEIDRLKILVEKFGRKWTLISKELKRSSDNCYDKFRQLGEDNMDERVKGIWKFQQLIELLKLIEKMTKIKFLDKRVEQQLMKSDFHDTIQKQEVATRKYNSKNFIFHNNAILKPYLNVRNFQKIDISQIRWNQISTYLKTRNIHDCRNKTVQLLQIFFHSEPRELDEKIVDFLIMKKYQNEHEINWKEWKNMDVTSEQAKNRFMIIKKMIEGRSIKPFKTIVLELKQRLDNKLKQKSAPKSKKQPVIVQDMSQE